MRDHLVALALAERDPGRRLNLAREYLQAHMLRSLQEAGAFAALAFQGGTALRFLHGLRRFSEDLDFALERPARGHDFEALLHAVRKDFERTGYALDIKLRAGRTVHSALCKFPGLLRETKLSSMRSENLVVRVEVDSRPPAGAVLETRLVTRHFPIVFLCHDLASCLAGKIHALLSRGHTKGRDLYDLAWYLTHADRPEPNFTLLRNALSQTGWRGPVVDEESWCRVLARQVRGLNWTRVRADALPFLEDPRDDVLLDRRLVLDELRRRPGRNR